MGGLGKMFSFSHSFGADVYFYSELKQCAYLCVSLCQASVRSKSSVASFNTTGIQHTFIDRQNCVSI